MHLSEIQAGVDDVEATLSQELASRPIYNLTFMIKQLFHQCNSNTIEPVCVGLGKPRVSHRRCGLQWWTEVRKLVLTRYVLYKDSFVDSLC